MKPQREGILAIKGLILIAGLTISIREQFVPKLLSYLEISTPFWKGHERD